ncbi:MAG: hypothetical protein H6736_01155 [Alphaproteobacteria bacterium]|nr:hypothetical protein [Alphaproteobacteria bacterium]MCB9690398.1 hypothetical protein [Alphaproteobacteria bacterium]
MSLESTFTPRPAPVYLLLHPAEPHRRGAWELVERACQPTLGLAAFNHGTYRADEGGPAAIAAARTLPMMAETRLVVVKDVELGENAFFDALLGYLTSPSPSTVLVLLGSGFPKVEKGTKRWSTPVEKAVGAAGGWILDRKSEPDPRRFATERAQGLGKVLEPAAARALVDLVGPDLGRLEREIEKLVLYVGDEPTIRPPDVEILCALVADAVIWDLTSALVRRDREASLAHLQRVLGDGLDPRHVLATITFKLRSVTAVADAIRRGADDAQAGRAGNMKSFEVRVVRTAVNGGLPGTDVVLGRLADAAFQMNNHRAGDRRILERLVVGWVT